MPLMSMSGVVKSTPALNHCNVFLAKELCARTSHHHFVYLQKSSRGEKQKAVTVHFHISQMLLSLYLGLWPLAVFI
jgi:hypothetical protein